MDSSEDRRVLRRSSINIGSGCFCFFGTASLIRSIWCCLVKCKSILHQTWFFKSTSICVIRWSIRFLLPQKKEAIERAPLQYWSVLNYYWWNPAVKVEHFQPAGAAKRELAIDEKKTVTAAVKRWRLFASENVVLLVSLLSSTTYLFELLCPMGQSCYRETFLSLALRLAIL